MKGEYTTQRDGGIKYTYEAECGMHGKDWHWRATVRHENYHLAGKPNGVILQAPSFVEDPILRQLVEDAIEKRIGVE